MIFTSGFGAELAGRDFSQEDYSFLPKPYQPQMVAQLVRNILDAPADWKPLNPATATQLVARPSGVASVQGTRTANASGG